MILAKALGGIANGAQHSGLEIGRAAHPIAQLVSDGIQKESVDGEIAPKRIGFGVTEGDVIRPASIGVTALGAEGGDLKLHAAFQHEHHAETFAHAEGLGKERLHLPRPRVGSQVVILGHGPA